jgi:hypothetical protein
VRSIVSAAQCGYLDRGTLKAMMEHALALQAEQANRAEPQPTRRRSNVFPAPPHWPKIARLWREAAGGAE